VPLSCVPRLIDAPDRRNKGHGGSRLAIDRGLR